MTYQSTAENSPKQNNYFFCLFAKNYIEKEIKLHMWSFFCTSLVEMRATDGAGELEGI